MYVAEGLNIWAANIVATVPEDAVRKLIAWWYGHPVHLYGKKSPISRRGESFEIWGKEWAKAHGAALQKAKRRS